MCQVLNLLELITRTHYSNISFLLYILHVLYNIFYLYNHVYHINDIIIYVHAYM